MKDYCEKLIEDEFKKTDVPIRRLNGEGWMYCRDCGAKLYSFDGDRDADRKCPYPNECG